MIAGQTLLFPRDAGEAGSVAGAISDVRVQRREVIFAVAPAAPIPSPLSFLLADPTALHRMLLASESTRLFPRRPFSFKHLLN